MGYYTTHELTVDGGPAEQRCPTCGNVAEWSWETLIGRFVADKYNWTEEYTVFQEEVKWYECDEHMIEFSAMYPEYTFIIEGMGEEPDDRWISYFKDGKTHKDHMIMRFPDFDPETLK